MQLSIRDPALNLNDADKGILDELDEKRIDQSSKKDYKEPGYDFREIKKVKEFKLMRLERLIKNAVDLKYKISLGKGARIFFETFIMLGFMFTLVMKANIFSIIYLVFVIKYLTSTENKIRILIRFNTYLCCCVAV